MSPSCSHEIFKQHRLVESNYEIHSVLIPSIRDTHREITPSNKIQRYENCMNTVVFKVNVWRSAFLGGTNELNCFYENFLALLNESLSVMCPFCTPVFYDLPSPWGYSHGQNIQQKVKKWNKNRREQKKFDNYFWKIVDCYYKSLISERKTGY